MPSLDQMRICFVVEGGFAMPTLHEGPPDGKTYLSIETAAKVTGATIEQLRQRYKSTFGDLSPMALAGEVAGDTTDDAERGTEATENAGACVSKPNAAELPPPAQATAPQSVAGNLMLAQIRELAARECYFPKLNDDEWRQVKDFCIMRRLDWTRRQVFAEYRWDETAGDNRLFVMMTIAGFRAEAHETERYAGCDEPVFTYDGGGQLIKATQTVYRLVGTTRQPFVGYAHWHNFYGPDNPCSAFAEAKPEIMLGKCAEAVALRRAFEVLDGIYITDELPAARRPRQPTDLGNNRKLEEVLDGYQRSQSGNTADDGEDEVCSRRTFDLAMKGEGVEDKQTIEKILAKARRRMSELARFAEDSAEESAFYARAYKDACRNRSLYGMPPKMRATA